MKKNLRIMVKIKLIVPPSPNAKTKSGFSYKGRELRIVIYPNLVIN